MAVVWLSHEQDCSCHLVGERQGHWTSYRMQTVPSKMPAVALWTDTSQGPPGTDREVKPREGLGPAEIGLGTGKSKGSHPPAWNPIQITAARGLPGFIRREASPGHPSDFSLLAGPPAFPGVSWKQSRQGSEKLLL